MRIPWKKRSAVGIVLRDLGVLNKKSPALKEIFICRVNPRETDQDLEIYQNYSPVRRIRLNNKLYAA